MTQFGRILIPRGYVFKWSINDSEKPEVYGWVEPEEGGPIVPKSAGWFRTPNPEEAVVIAKHNLYGDGLISREEAGL